MLKKLTVSNLAVVEKAEAEFASGLTVLTGETGAGKSVLMGALELVLGGRADSTVVRDGAKEARVEAVFEPGPAAAAVFRTLEEAGLPACEEGELVVRRVVAAGGSGKAWVNDSPATVATLRRLGASLVDIHGPRANQRILEERFQRETLDAYGRVDATAYAAAWAALGRVRAEIAALDAAGDVTDELDLLRFQVNELEQAGLAEDDDDLAERHAAAAHAEEIAVAANEITEALGGDGGVADGLSRLGPLFASVTRHLPEAADWAAQAEELTVKVQELSRSVADAAARIDVDPVAFEEMDRRLGVVNRLRRKYLKEGGGVPRLLEILEAKRARLDALEHRGERLEGLRAEEAKAAAAVKEAGAALTAARRSAGRRLAKAVTRGLRDLGFLKAGFAVSLAPAEAEAHGCDRVAYLFEPNPGEAAREFAAVASSGEAARVMLALKGVLAEHDATDTLVFDEIDANIGGEVGRAVGERMRAVAAHHQVVAITHLPQSAVYADRHLVVSKAVSGGRTRTRIAAAEGAERAAEIARMLGGEGPTGTVRRHAEELLDSAKRQ